MLLALAVAAAAQAGIASAQSNDYVKSLAPYVPTPQKIVERMLEEAHVRPNEVVYDLGSGDGRVVITASKEFRARSVGVEISKRLVEAANRRIRAEGLADRCRVIQGDIRNVDLSKADVVVLYLLTSSNELLRPKLERSLKPGSRVVSHDFEIREWNPSKVVQAEAHGRIHSIFVYHYPFGR